MMRIARAYAVTGCVAAIFCLVYLALDFNRLYALRYGADLGTFVQTLVNVRHGSSWNGAEWRPHFQVHNSWVLSVLALPIAIAPRTETLLVIQVLTVAFAAFPLVAFARRVGNTGIGADLLGAAYLIAPATQGLAYENFTEAVFVPLFAFCAALAVRARRLLPALIVGQLLLGLKEDQALFVAWFAIACALWWDRRIGVTLLVLAMLNGFAFEMVERFHGVHTNQPGYSLAIYDPGAKLGMIALLLLPFAFTPLAIGRWLLLGVPLLAEILFAEPWAFEVSRIGSHWVAPLSAGTAVAAAIGLPRWPAATRALIPCALIAGIVFSDTVVKVGRWPYIVDWSRYARAAGLRDGTQGAVIPREDEGVWAVAAVNPRVRLALPSQGLGVKCPAYNRDATAFFGSIGVGAPKTVLLCGGVPVPPGTATPKPYP